MKFAHAHSVVAIAAELGVSRQTIYRHLRELGIPGHDLFKDEWNVLALYAALDNRYVLLIINELKELKNV